MNNELIFIRHAETKIDKEIPIADWVLTEKGDSDAEKLKDVSEFLDVDILISSGEKKAYLTIKPLADKLGKEIIQIKGLGEISRPNSESLTKEEYVSMKEKVFKDLDFTDYGWETCSHALERFRKAVEEIDREYENKKIIISAHGTVLSLYFASLLGELKNLEARWKSLGFCNWGIVRNGKVFRDIVYQ